MRFLLYSLTLLALVLSGCAPAPESKPAVKPASTGGQRAPYPDLGPAPELVGDVWLNTSSPLQIAGLNGKVVLVEMWTFGCINCIHVIPSVRGWHQKYADKGLVVIGNHYPEFDHEKDLANLKQAIVNLDVPYPVVQDNSGANWRAFGNHYWPTMYLIDKNGHIRYVHIGEGNYDETEKAIAALLAESTAQ